MANRLTPPAGARDHAQGPADAPVTLVEYGDYQCPHCGRAHPIVTALRKHFGAKLRFVFRNFPLGEVHPQAVAAAEAAEAAAAQEKFWPMHDRLFENQDALGDEALLGYAQQVGLDIDRWVNDLQTDAVEERVREDFMSGVRSGVAGTPTFYIDGHRHDGGFEDGELRAALEAALAGRRPG